LLIIIPSINFFLDLDTFLHLHFGQVILHIGCAAYARTAIWLRYDLASQRVVSGKGVK